MRQPLLQRASRGRQSSGTASSPAPVGGWNARDPEAAMKPTEAVWLENWRPGTSDVTVRGGVTFHATGIGEKVLTVMGYNSTTSNSLWAATDAGIYDATVAGPVGAADHMLTDGKLCYTLFTVLGGTYLQAVNGTDDMVMYDGSTWMDVNGTSTPAITGLATDQMANICVFKRRIWYVEKDSMSAWYLPVDQIAGALEEFPLGQLFVRGGYLMAMTNWTIDGGNGVDDYVVFITSEGEAAVYKGSDPTTAADFALVGVYYVGEPIGRKCCIKYGGDALLLTQTGLYPLSKAFQSATLNRSVAVSNKIDSVFSASAGAYGANYGWEGLVFPTENLLMVNIPIVTQSQSYQFAMNTITGAWSLFTGWNAFSWEAWQGGLYFGGNGYVAKALDGTSDFGNDIVALGRGAYNYFKSYDQKHFKLFRPIVRVSGAAKVELGVDVDFESSTGTADIGPATIDYAIWDNAVWDVGLWGDEYEIRKEWHSLTNTCGFCAAVRLRATVKNGRVGWSSTDFLFQKGGVL